MVGKVWRPGFLLLSSCVSHARASTGSCTMQLMQLLCRDADPNETAEGNDAAMCCATRHLRC